MLTGGDVGGHRNLFVLRPDWALCNTDAPRLLSVNGTFALPLGRGERFLGNASGVVNQVVGGWRVNVIGNYSSGQPFTIGCTTATTTGHGCNNNLANFGRITSLRLGANDQRQFQFALKYYFWRFRRR